jgi:hypothetical protein
MTRQKNIVFAAFASTLVLTTGCSDIPDKNDAKIEVKIPEQQNKFLEITSLPTANYTEFDDDIYMYESQPTEKEIAEGKILGSISQFKYLGQDKLGFHKIGSYSDRIFFVSKCKDPCKVIYREDEKLPFNSETIIGAVFEDVINGKIDIAKNYKFLNYDEYKESVKVRYIKIVPNEFRRQWYVKYDKGNDFSFLFSRDGKAILYRSKYNKLITSEIDFLRVTNVDFQTKYYDVIFDNNRKQIRLIADENNETLLAFSSDGNRTRFSPRDYQ